MIAETIAGNARVSREEARTSIPALVAKSISAGQETSSPVVNGQPVLSSVKAFK